LPHQRIHFLFINSTSEVIKRVQMMGITLEERMVLKRAMIKDMRKDSMKERSRDIKQDILEGYMEECSLVHFP
jgi:hypothetical protein